VIVENYLPGSLAKYKMDYATVSKINPSIIYASITGYGQTGPNSSRAGYDVMVEAEMGLMHITGHRDGPPAKVGVAVTDLTTGLYTSNSIMAALLARARPGGKGQHIDVSLADCQIATLANIASSCLISGKPDSGRWGTAHPSIVPYMAFPTSDGDIVLGGGNDRLFGVLCERIGKPEWKDDVKYKTNADRVRVREELEERISEVTRTKTTKEWLGVFEGSGMPYAPINDVKSTLEDEHGESFAFPPPDHACGHFLAPKQELTPECVAVAARQMVTDIEHPSCGPIKLVSPPVKFSETPPTIRTPPPTLGQHTDEVLMEVLGMEQGEVEKLRGEGVVA
jgi:succinate--hydroxymethylglutarate CoA-transferase